MKRFTKLFMTLALLCVAGSVSAEKLESDFSEITTINQATWDASTKTMGWSASWSNALSYFMIKGIDKVGDTYDLSSWKTITITISDLSETTNGVRIRMKDNSGGDGDWILMTKGTNTINITDFKKGGVALDYSHIGGIQLSGGNNTSGASTATFTELYLERPDDPLALPKETLSNAIALGEMQNDFAKTTESFNTLTTAIADGKTALADAGATVESLSAATLVINNAIKGLTLVDGYSNLTKEMFMNHTAQGEDGTATGCAYDLFVSVGMPYGDGNVYWLNYADLSQYDKLYVTVAGGTPRFCMNRIADNAQDNDNPETSEFIDIPGHAWGTEAYQTIQDENIYVVDLAKLVSDRGIAYLHSIKGAYGGKVTVTGMYLYKSSVVPVTIGATGYATFCSKKSVALETSMQAYAVEFTGTSALLTPVEGSVGANTPVILNAAAGNYDLDIVESATVPEKNDLDVSDGTIAGDGTIYVLANGTKGVGFYLLKSGDKIPAGKAYLMANNAGGREFIGFAGEATAIKSVETVKADGAIYNLAGQQVKNAQKGVFIVGGKKVIK